ncbi:MAG: phosphomannomutase, partial [Deltaproteobacteria bacterium]|nr:phosphomannomutase [Deltaproteobacteria bacterium]
MELNINPAVFREYDIRGIAGKDLTPAFARALGLSYAKYLSTHATPKKISRRFTVSLGWDCRLSSHDYKTALTEGLIAGGLDVITLGVCPTPLVYFSLFHLDVDGGVMITGSHNPADYNGFKTCVGHSTLFGSQIQELKKIMQSNPSTSPQSGNLT